MSWKAFNLFCSFFTFLSYFTVLFFQFLAPVFPHGGLPHWELLLVHYRGCCPVDCSGPGGWRTLHLGVGPLVCPGRDCLCGGAPCGRGPGALSVWSVPQGWLFPCLRSGWPAVSLSDRCSGSELVYLCVRACVCVCLSPYLSGYFMGVGWLVCFIIVVFSLCEALCVTFKVWKVPYK